MTLHQLIKSIENHLETNKNLKNAIHYLVNYKSDDWKKYCNFSSEGYLRNLVHKSDKFDIFVICWSKNCISSIHDHPERGCLMKVLNGILEEELYSSDNIKNKLNHSILVKDDIKYIDDIIGYHRISNNCNPSISLHIYSPGDFETKKYD